MYLALWEEGAKGPKGKSSWQKLKASRSNLEMIHLGIPKKEIKGFLARNKRDMENNKTRPNQRIVGLITSQPIRSMGI